MYLHRKDVFCVTENNLHNLINNLLEQTPKKLPQKLYKYTCVNSERMDAWLHGNVYMASPLELNDPYECKTLYFDKNTIRKAFAHSADPFILKLENKLHDLIHYLAILATACFRLTMPKIWKVYVSSMEY